MKNINCELCQENHIETFNDIRALNIHKSKSHCVNTTVKDRREYMRNFMRRYNQTYFSEGQKQKRFERDVQMFERMIDKI